MVNNNDVVKIAVHGTGMGGKDMVNVYCYKFTTDIAITETAFLAQVQIFIVSMMAAIALWMKTTVKYSYCIAFNVTQNIEIGSINLSVAGAKTDDTLPFGVAALTTGRTAQLKVRGRKFLWGLVESASDNQYWIGQVVSALATYAAKYLEGSTWDAGKKKLVVGVLYGVAHVFTAITSTAASGTPAYQRRRKPTT